jgi:hypothetical protein
MIAYMDDDVIGKFNAVQILKTDQHLLNQTQ